jgi:hypothetical protein
VTRNSPVRQIGPVGTAARTAGGLAAIVLPIVSSGITWWDAGDALLVLPLTAAVAAWGTAVAYQRAAADRLRRGAVEAWVRSSLVLALVLAVHIALTFLTPLDGAVGFWIFIGLSLLVAAFRGDAGCEAIAIPNALAGRRDPTGCVIYFPIDAAEARR